jgi:nucleotide-binding universal stress UspA family protein
VTAQILVPLDGSPLAEHALACATTLGRGLPAELVLFRAVSIPPDTREILDSAGLEAATLTEQLEVEASDYLRRIADQLQDAGLGVRQVVRHGPAAEAIVDYAEQTDIQQIVMATHGHTGISHWTHGSVAERVLQSASVPVLLVRAQEGELSASREPMPCRRILVPLDGSDVAEQVLPSATSIAQALRAEMILFQVPIVYVSGSLIGEWYLPWQGVLRTAEQDAQAYLNRVAYDLKEQGVKVSTAMQIGAVAESIIAYAEANRIDLIAMCTHGRTGLGRWILGSVADRVLRASSIPILLVRAR